MQPSATIYRIATDDDEPSLLVMPNGLVARRFPTVVAERDGEIIGYLGTHDRHDVILAGPMDICLESERAKGVIASRLIQAYETVLLLAGVDFYFYTVRNGKWREATERSPRTTFCSETPDGVCLFKRELPPIVPAGVTVH